MLILKPVYAVISGIFSVFCSYSQALNVSDVKKSKRG